MSAPPTRTRLLLAATVALAALVLTGCRDGKGLRDEGPSSMSSPTAYSAGNGAPTPSAPTAP